MQPWNPLSAIGFKIGTKVLNGVRCGAAPQHLAVETWGGGVGWAGKQRTRVQGRIGIRLESQGLASRSARANPRSPGLLLRPGELRRVPVPLQVEMEWELLGCGWRRSRSPCVLEAPGWPCCPRRQKARAGGGSCAVCSAPRRFFRSNAAAGGEAGDPDPKQTL